MISVIPTVFPQDEFEYTVEIVVGVEAHFDAPPRLAGELDSHIGLKVPPEAVLERSDCRARFGARPRLSALRLRGVGRGRDAVELAYVLLQLPNVHSAGDAFLGDTDGGVSGVEGEECASMAETQRRLFDHLLNRFRESENAKEVRDRRAIFRDRVGDLLLRELELVDEATVAARFVDRVQVGALEILDEGENEQGAIVEIANDRGDLGPAEVGRGAEAPLAGDELERVAASADGDGLQQAAHLERGLELGELCRIEIAPRLEWIRPDAR